MADGEEAFQTTLYIIGLTTGIISCILMVLFITRHVYWMYQDLYTDERKSVSHRRNPPERTSVYKWVNWWSLAVMITGCSYSFLMVGLYFATDIGTCRSLFSPALSFGSASRISVFCVYVLRLHMVYKGSEYEFKVHHLKLSLVAIVLVYFLSTAPMSIYAGVTDDKLKNEDGEYREEDIVTGFIWRYQINNNEWFYNTCYFTIPLFYMGFFAFCDFIVNAGFLYVFVKPIKDVLGRLNSSTRNLDEKSKTTKKMLFIGFKVALLCVVLFISSLVANGIYTITLMNVFPVDLLINTVCIAFMTQYYPDSDYYEVYCKCCIRCCDKNGYTSSKYHHDELIPPSSPDAEAGRTELTVTDVAGSKVDSRGLSSVKSVDSMGSDNISAAGPSVDTMSAIRITAKEQAPLKQVPAGQDNELAAHLSPDS